MSDSLDYSECRLVPYDHQFVGIESLARWDNPETNRIYGGCFALFDDMGLGKTKTVIDAAQFLFRARRINRVVVVAPGGVRGVWYDQTVGELMTHLWESTIAQVIEYHSKSSTWNHGDFTPESFAQGKSMQWLITNYEFIRATGRAEALLEEFCTDHTLMVCDESSFIKNHKSGQFKACLKLRKRCRWIYLLNGTPIANSIGDLFSQGLLLDKRILDCPSYTQFTTRYAVMKPIMGPGGKPVESARGFILKSPASWTGVEDIQQRFAPYVLRRLKVDCLDLPEKMPPLAVPVAMTPVTWNYYVEMRDEMMTWLSNATGSMAQQAIIKIMRLAQLTSGFLGGLEEFQFDEDGNIVLVLPEDRVILPVQEIGREKLDATFDFMDIRLMEDENSKGIIWMRFAPEIARCLKETRARYPHVKVGVIAGGYSKAEREYALQLLHPKSAPAGPVFVIGNPQSGGLGLNLTAAWWMWRASSDYSHYKRAQSEDRIHRPGQTRDTTYFDLIATGPKGQRTIDHIILAALTKKENVATYTMSAWLDKLRETC